MTAYKHCGVLVNGARTVLREVTASVATGPLSKQLHGRKRTPRRDRLNVVPGCVVS